MSSPPLRFVLLLDEGHLDLPFTDGEAQILATAYPGALGKTVRLRVASAELLTVDVAREVVFDGGSGGPGRLKLGPGSLVELGLAVGVVLPTDGAPLAKRAWWPKWVEWMAEERPVLLLRLAALGDPGLLAAALAGAAQIPLDVAAAELPLFAALIDGALNFRDPKSEAAVLAAVKGKEALLGDEARALLARLQQDADAAAQARAATIAAYVRDTSPEHDGGADQPTIAWDIAPVAADRGHGWFGGASSLPAEQQPRSALDGQPMTHLCTLRVPREYRTRGAEQVGLALFQDLKSGENTTSPEPAHPREERIEDHIGGEFVVVWLDAAELARAPAGSGHRWVELRARFEDFNAGKPTHGPGYRQPKPEEVGARARNHFGGTTSSYETQQPPRYLQLEGHDVGANFGGDDGHLDLETSAITWGED